MATKCPKCRADNPETARFCSNCARALMSIKPDQPAVTETLQSPTRAVATGTVFARRYEILDSLGAGGMGEVYRALDNSLDRYVAIKVLPTVFAEDQERMARFEREAKLLAVLNHSNIAAIHSLEESQGRRFLILELVEGETLQTRINRGALTLDETLEICGQLAEGLEAAHEKGIIHRDLKPGNIMITHEGKTKILDFGLAKAYRGETSGIDIEKSPTITAQMTEPGIILGTAAYMSPEQAQCRPVDRRTDIWSFGCILFECLTGKRAFQGETIPDTLAHLLKGEPTWELLPAATPQRVKELIQKCLRKNHKVRLRDIGDVRIELEDALKLPPAPVQRGIRALVSASPRLVASLGLMILAVGAAVAILFIQPWKRSSFGPNKSVRMQIGVEPANQIGGGYPAELTTGDNRPSRTSFVFSPNGNSIIFEGLGDQGPQLYFRSLDTWTAVPIAGTTGGIDPFISPDGSWVGFWANGTLKKAPIGGGTAVTLCDVPSVPDFGVSWGSNDTIIFSRGDRLWRVSAGGGKAAVLVAPDAKKGEVGFVLPHFLPSGEAILFTVQNSTQLIKNPRVEILSLESLQRRILIDEGADARYSSTGHLIFIRQGTLCAVPFDLTELAVTGPVVQLIENVMQASDANNEAMNTYAGQFDFSPSGTLGYILGGPYHAPAGWLLWIDKSGNAQPVLDVISNYFAPRVSPDGTHAAYCVLQGKRGIGVIDIERRIAMPLTTNPADLWNIWTPDSSRVTFSRSERPGLSKIMWVPADGSGEAESLVESESRIFPSSWSPQGDLLAYVKSDPDTRLDIWVLRSKDRKSEAFINTQFSESFPEFSPDGHWMAYVSNETGQLEVYVRPYPGPGQKIKVSNEGGWIPCWGPSGRQIYYVSGNRILSSHRLMVVDVETTSTFSAGIPRLIMDCLGYGLIASPVRGYDIHPDGKRFIGWGHVYGGGPIKRSDLPEDLLQGLESGDSRSLLRFGYWLKTGGQRKLSPDWEALDRLAAVTDIKIVQNWFEELKRLVPSGNK